uniref:Glutamate decarboxylase like 1 n=1 Tax=Sus scrofa TaxID=9823 RepID=A0A8D0PJU4_PIG
MSFPPGNLPKCKTGPSFVPSTSALWSELCPQGTLVAQLNLSLPFLETHRVGSMLLTSSLALALAGAQLTVPLLNLQVCEWQPPEQLKQLLDLELRDTGEPHNRLLELCQDVIRYSVKTNHPRFFNQLYAGLDYYSLVARFMTEALNPSVYTYEVSPVFLLVEEAVLKKMIEFIGWKEGDGIFNPGGSVSNMYAMNLARYKYCPDIKEKGLSGLPRLILFTSAECHYSMKKAASFLGIGTENVCFVETDGRGKMIPEELEKQVWQARREGAAPFLVCATSGTTVLGAFDPLNEIADICERHGLWLHVDVSSPVCAHFFGSLAFLHLWWEVFHILRN